MYAYNATGTSLPANTLFDIEFHRYGSDGIHNEPYMFTRENRKTSSNGIVVSPTYYDTGTITYGDFGTEYVNATFIRHSDQKIYGNAKGSVSQFKCENGNAVRARKARVKTPAA